MNLVSTANNRSGGKPPSALVFQGRITELDGLRAIAVIFVLLHHVGPLANRGSRLWKIEEVGWIGVELFFVLSGFLITGILLDSREKKFYYSNFYVRRALRIFPLYYSLLFIGMVIAVHWHGGYDYQYFLRTWGHPWWFFLYVGNLRSAFRELAPNIIFLCPLWSLQVEEQFYLLFPFLVRKLEPDRLFRILLSVVVLSGPIRWVFYMRYPHHPLGIYLATPFRLDGLALGGLLAIRTRMGPWRIRHVHVATLTILLLGGLWAYLAWGGYESSTGRISTFGHSLVALAFASVLLCVLRFRDSWQTSWLRAGPLQHLGKISYGIYVLQIPAYDVVRTVTTHFGFQFFKEDWNCRPTVWSIFWIIGAMTVLFASLSWYCFEQPILSMKEKLTRDPHSTGWNDMVARFQVLPRLDMNEGASSPWVYQEEVYEENS